MSFYVEFVREERKSSRVEVFDNPKIVPLPFVCGKKAEREKR
jgi:hypothetical protein